jgi:hypothetical protein
MCDIRLLNIEYRVSGIGFSMKPTENPLLPTGKTTKPTGNPLLPTGKTTKSTGNPLLPAGRSMKRTNWRKTPFNYNMYY